MDEIKHRLLISMADTMDYLLERLNQSRVFTVLGQQPDAVLVRLHQSSRLKHIKLMPPTRESIDYTTAATERFEGEQPRCVIGSLDGNVLTPDNRTAFECGLATWHVLPPGVPITRAAEIVIVMDWGMRVHGIFPTI